MCIRDRKGSQKKRGSPIDMEPPELLLDYMNEASAEVTRAYLVAYLQSRLSVCESAAGAVVDSWAGSGVLLGREADDGEFFFSVPGAEKGKQEEGADVSDRCVIDLGSDESGADESPVKEKGEASADSSASEHPVPMGSPKSPETPRQEAHGFMDYVDPQAEAQLEANQFRSIMEGKSRTFQEFFEFCKSVHGEENVMMYREIRRFELAPASKKEKQAKLIYSLFLAPESVLPVNLPLSYTHNIYNRYGELTDSFFEPARKALFQNLRNDLWRRFQMRKMSADLTEITSDMTPKRRGSASKAGRRRTGTGGSSPLTSPHGSKNWSLRKQRKSSLK
eukprot:TRINITY_DN20765_c0_g1_i1.p1 TRINITY_DN20765_c0_g1~~TRINITY_DN20765_c0_g1_i1.p1  ORF type:complete len:335 (-),score=-56.15 TRINITY_DN20765_c0_g1_i1:60-1064(-)